MLILRPYKAGDFELLPPRPSEVGIEAAEREIDPLRSANPGWTLFSGEGDIRDPISPYEAVGAAGVIVFRKGVGEAWLRGSIRFGAHRCAIARKVRCELKKIIRDCGLHRVQMIVSERNELARYFATWLGFQYEGRMRQAGEDRSDFLMLAWAEERPLEYYAEKDRELGERLKQARRLEG